MLAETAETVTVAVPAWLLAVVAFLGTLLGGAISFAVNQILIKGAADRAAKKREKDDERRRERYILRWTAERLHLTCYPAFVPALSEWRPKRVRFIGMEN